MTSAAGEYEKHPLCLGCYAIGRCG